MKPVAVAGREASASEQRPETLDTLSSLGLFDPRDPHSTFKEAPDRNDSKLRAYTDLRLAATGLRPLTESDIDSNPALANLQRDLLERTRNSFGEHPPITARVQTFLERFLRSSGEEVPRLPGRGQVLVLDEVGMAARLSLPEDASAYVRPWMKSYDLGEQGVLHNPENDRRTTAGTFHVVKGGPPVTWDKKEVPKAAFSRLLGAALQPPGDFATLPYTIETGEAKSLVTFQMHVLTAPGVPGFRNAQYMETQVIAPGEFVSGVDFLERIFGNAGNPYHAVNDLGLDPEYFNGVTSLIVVAPHLVDLKKQDLGLPHKDEATPRQIRDGMYWEQGDELYNDGKPFKISARDESGVVVTIVAGDYFGYLKKTEKEHGSFAANVRGMAQEEHAGGAVVFARYGLGDFFSAENHLREEHTFDQALALLGERAEQLDNGLARDTKNASVVYVPESFRVALNEETGDYTVSWRDSSGLDRSDSVNPDLTYVLPSGFRINLEKDPATQHYSIVGTEAEGVFCHKPCSVSGSGKSELSKALGGAITTGGLIIRDFDQDVALIKSVLEYDVRNRFKDLGPTGGRPILSPERSLGSVIKLLTPSESEYTVEYNEFVTKIPYHVKEWIFHLKSVYSPEMGPDWERYYSVEERDGVRVNHLHFRGEPVERRYLRVGFSPDGMQRTFSVRQDFYPSTKLQREDDISASITVPGRMLARLDSRFRPDQSYKLVLDVEQVHFQRPDDCAKPGYDATAEAHIAGRGNFIVNFEPLGQEIAKRRLLQRIQLERFSEPMQRHIEKAAERDGYFVASDSRRILPSGKPSPNPRFLERRADLIEVEPSDIAEVGTRLSRKLPFDQPLLSTVDVVLPGRRLNPPDPERGIKPLSVYGPIHFQELPELYADFVSCLSGKSPSTTGNASAELANTKGPFNSLPLVVDLNDALVSDILTRTNAFTTAAGYVGPRFKVDHDITMVVPEIFSRLSEQEREPKYLIENGFLERVPDVEYEGERIPSGMLGYRITPLFVNRFFGKAFNHPHLVFTEEMLRPEQQDLKAFADGVKNIVDSGRQVAEHYFQDGTIEMACPPLKALLHMMRDGYYDPPSENGRPERWTWSSPAFREQFTFDSLVSSDWYQERLRSQQQKDLAAWSAGLERLEEHLKTRGPALTTDERREYELRRERMESLVAAARGAEYLEYIRGTTGADPAL